MTYEILEWFATFLSVTGVLILALKLKEKYLTYTWILWLISAIIYSYIFFKKGNNGLLFGQLLCIGTSLLGFYQWTQKQNHQMLTKIILVVISLLILKFLHHIFIYILQNDFKQIHWIASCATILGSLLMASRSKFAIFSWGFWLTGNILSAYIAYVQGIEAFLLLQIVFIVVNTIGVYYWFRDFMKPVVLQPA